MNRVEDVGPVARRIDPEFVRDALGAMDQKSDYIQIFRMCQKCFGHGSLTNGDTCECARGWVLDRFALIEDVSRVRAVLKKTFHFWLNPNGEIVGFPDSDSQDVLPNGGVGWKFLVTKQIELGMPL